MESALPLREETMKCSLCRERIVFNIDALFVVKIPEKTVLVHRKCLRLLKKELENNSPEISVMKMLSDS